MTTKTDLRMLSGIAFQTTEAEHEKVRLLKTAGTRLFHSKAGYGLPCDLLYFYEIIGSHRFNTVHDLFDNIAFCIPNFTDVVLKLRTECSINRPTNRSVLRCISKTTRGIAYHVCCTAINRISRHRMTTKTDSANSLCSFSRGQRDETTHTTVVYRRWSARTDTVDPFLLLPQSNTGKVG